MANGYTGLWGSFSSMAPEQHLNGLFSKAKNEGKDSILNPSGTKKRISSLLVCHRPNKLE